MFLNGYACHIRHWYGSFLTNSTRSVAKSFSSLRTYRLPQNRRINVSYAHTLTDPQEAHLPPTFDHSPDDLHVIDDFDHDQVPSASDHQSDRSEKRHDHNNLVPRGSLGGSNGTAEPETADGKSRVENKSLRLSAASIKDALLQQREIPRRSYKIKWGEHKSNKTLASQEIKDKGDWSHDWRAAFNLLMAHSVFSASAGNIEKELHALRRARTKFARWSSYRLDDHVKEPVIWSSESFTGYVIDLTLFRPQPIYVRRIFNGRGGERPYSTNGVALILFELFQRPDLRKYITPEACCIAIDFLAHHSLPYDARKLFLLFEQLSVEIGIPGIHCMMRRAANVKDLQTFTWLLYRMLQRGLRPNEETWYHFHQCLDTVSVKKLVAAEMKRLGLPKNAETAKIMQSSTFNHDLRQVLEDGGDHATLLQRLDRELGPGCLSGRTGRRIGNQILNEMRTRVPIGMCIQLVDELAAYKFRPDHVTLHMLMYHCLRTRRPEQALNILELSETQWDAEPGRDEFLILFTHGWEHGSLNLCSAIWTAACTNGAVGRRMYERIRYSLRLSAALEEESSRAPSEEVLPEHFPVKMPPKGRKNFLSLVGKFVLNLPLFEPVSRDQVQRAIARDMARAGRCQLTEPLSQLLSRCLALDRRWKLHDGEHLEEKLAQRVPILYRPAF